MDRINDVASEGSIIEPDPEKIRDVSYGAVDIQSLKTDKQTGAIR